MSFPYLQAYLGFKTVMHLLESYLDWRQLQKTREKEIPVLVKKMNMITQDEFDKSRAYTADKRVFGMVHSWFDFFVGFAFILYFNPMLWQKVVAHFGAENEITCSLAWLLVLHWATLPLNVCWSLYSDFVIEERHGFNKKTYGLFFMDLLKSELISMVLGGILIPCLIWIVHWGGDMFYIYLWAFVQTFVFVMMFIYPTVIMPLFNKLEPLEDEELKKKIEALAATVNFPLTKLFQMDGSKRSAHSNAFMFGFGKNKRIVIFDTLLEHCNHKEILAILAHELGHWLYSHVLIMMIMSSIQIFVIFYLYGQVMYSKELFAAFFYPNTNAVIIGLMLFSNIFSPVEAVIDVLMTLFSRRNEFQADHNAVQMGYAEDLQSGLRKITKENKGDVNPDPWYAWYHFSHPAMVERLNYIEEQAKIYEAEKKKSQ